MTALEAAKKMMAERGHCVIGYLGEELFEGDRFGEWSGQTLGDYQLICMTQTDRADWDAQFAAIFAAKCKDPDREGCTYWRAILNRRNT